MVWQNGYYQGNANDRSTATAAATTPPIIPPTAVATVVPEIPLST